MPLSALLSHFHSDKNQEREYHPSWHVTVMQSSSQTYPENLEVKLLPLRHLPRLSLISHTDPAYRRSITKTPSDSREVQKRG